MVSVVIAAHNEEAVIRDCLDAVLAGEQPPTVIVSANGCTDRTVAVSERPGVVVIDRTQPGKAAALNAGDRVAVGFPRIYLDADIIVPRGAVAALAAAVQNQDGVLVAVPRRRIDVDDSSWPVRAYFAINERLPAFRAGLFGRGMITLSHAGRARFDAFPDLIADDLFLDSLFEPHERSVVAAAEVVVRAPRTTRDLLNRLARVRRGNAQLRAADTGAAGAVRPSDRWAWLRDVVLPKPWLAPAAIPYVIITLMAAVRARGAGTDWGHDASSRVVDSEGAHT